LKSSVFTRVDVIDDGEKLASIADGSEDFIIANHVFEHLEDPLLALENWLRVVRTGGVIFLSVPNKNKTFDLNRAATTFDHLLMDLRHGPQVSRRQHYLEWVTQVGDMSGPDAEDHATHLMETRHSIHFHCWDPAALWELLLQGREELGLPMDVDLFEVQGNEMLVIIRKAGKAATEATR
jgi:SAM-dependent methyltransferase